MHSCIYEGSVRHRRHAPTPHAFKYRLFMMYVDLSELDELFAGRWFWSSRAPNLAWLRRADYLGDANVPLDQAVRDLVEQRTGRRPRGRIGLLTHLRYFGYVMNPVSFYFCWDERDVFVETIVAEIQNTPWGERHCYVLDESMNETAPGRPRFRFDKEFHISPFMAMEQSYDWRFSDPAKTLAVHMENLEAGSKHLDVTMAMRRRPITGPQLARVLVRYPLMTAKVIAAIYFQALRLWWKRTPFHPHPKHRVTAKAGAA